MRVSIIWLLVAQKSRAPYVFYKLFLMEFKKGQTFRARPSHLTKEVKIHIVELIECEQVVYRYWLYNRWIWKLTSNVELEGYINRVKQKS